MLALLEIFAYVSTALTLGIFGVTLSLVIIDKAFLVLSFIIVKIFIDRQATFSGFNLVWAQAKGNKK